MRKHIFPRARLSQRERERHSILREGNHGDYRGYSFESLLLPPSGAPWRALYSFVFSLKSQTKGGEYTYIHKRERPPRINKRHYVYTQHTIYCATWQDWRPESRVKIPKKKKRFSHLFFFLHFLMPPLFFFLINNNLGHEKLTIADAHFSLDYTLSRY